MQVFKRPPSQKTPPARILKGAVTFAAQGYDGTTTRDLAQAAGVEGTLFRHFANKRILIEVATQGWVEILTDLLTELSEMGSC